MHKKQKKFAAKINDFGVNKSLDSVLKEKIIKIHKGKKGRLAYIAPSEVSFLTYILKKHYYQKKKSSIKINYNTGDLKDKISFLNDILILNLYNASKYIKKGDLYDNSFIKECENIIDNKRKMYLKFDNKTIDNLDRFSNIIKDRLPDLLEILIEFTDEISSLEENRKKIYLDRCLDLINLYNSTESTIIKEEIRKTIPMYSKSLDEKAKNWIYKTIFHSH